MALPLKTATSKPIPQKLNAAKPSAQPAAGSTTGMDSKPKLFTPNTAKPLSRPTSPVRSRKASFGKMA